MPAYRELIKNFNKVRGYLSAFLVYGVHGRGGAKSARTYDDEKRRIQSFAGDCLKSGTARDGKTVYISMDASRLKSNPLYRAYRIKSFTRNDIHLHFILLDLLALHGRITVREATDYIVDDYEMYVEPQTVRNKLDEYASEGIIERGKAGRAILYGIKASPLDCVKTDDEARDLASFLAMFSEYAPLGVVGSFIQDTVRGSNLEFLFKHHYTSWTLDDEVLLELLTAIREKRRVKLTLNKMDHGTPRQTEATPFYIPVGITTGRRYALCLRRGQFVNIRLDQISRVQLLDRSPDDYDALRERALELQKGAWGVSLKGENTSHLRLRIGYDAQTEAFIPLRLVRERRNGEVRVVESGVAQFDIDVSDPYEMTPWLRTFTGRILSLECDDAEYLRYFWADARKMRAIYGGQR